MRGISVWVVSSVGSALLASQALATDADLRASVVQIEVTKFVARKTTGGNLRPELESYVGSGFWSAGTNRIVTCAHVIEGARDVIVIPNSSPGAPSWSAKNGQVTLCMADRAYDIAVLQVPEVGPGLPLATSIPGTRRPIQTVGHTENYPWRINSGELTGIIAASQLAIPVEGDVLVCDATFGPGSSGGIVVDEQERILGMIEGAKEGGQYGTRIAIPATAIQRFLQSVPSGQPCGGQLITSGPPIIADENTFADLISKNDRVGEKFPARYWGQVSYGVISGIDRFDEWVPAVRFDLMRSWTPTLSWQLSGEIAQRSVELVDRSGPQQIHVDAQLSRTSVVTGPRMLVGEFGRISIYSAALGGYVHERVRQEATFISPLFAPQTNEEAIDGVLGSASLVADIQVITNLRVGWSGEVWAGSGGIGSGVTNRFGVSFGVGHGVR